MLGPLAKALVKNGLTYPVFAQALKRVFLEAARGELEQSGKRVTDSALSLLSGVHRKDVRVMNERSAPPEEPPRAWSLASEVITRWLTDPALQDSTGRPLRLPLRGQDDEPSFERLSQSVSKDFHSRSVLDELQRLGLVQVDDETAALTGDLFLPSSSFVDRAYFFGQNVRDHVAACAMNLQEQDGEPPFLEYAIYADKLSAESAHQLHVRARQLWLKAFRQVVADATTFEHKDRALSPEQRAMRMRFGVYFYSEAMAPAQPTVSHDEQDKE